MSIIQGNAHTSAGGGGYQIERSLRFNSADSAYLNRTLSSSGNMKVFTLSFWLKRTALGVINNLFTVRNAIGSGAEYFQIKYNANDTISVIGRDSGSVVRCNVSSTAVFRDPGAWAHIVISFNASSTTLNVYANNVVIANSTSIGNVNYGWNNSALTYHRIGDGALLGEANLNGYMAELYHVDGQALTPSSFGETDSNTGVWKPKAFSGTYGTNGFYLKFADNSGTTSTTLGKDSSGNGNNWTPNNFSVTAGVGNDSLVDTPTNYGTDTGVGGEVRGNYATLNPLNKNTSGTLSNGNLEWQASTTAVQVVTGTSTIIPSGKTYFELNVVTAAGSGTYFQVGIAPPGKSLTSAIGNASGNGYSIEQNQADDIQLRLNGTSTTISTVVQTGDVLQVAVDYATGKLWFGRNNTWYNSSGGTTGNPAAGTNETATISTTTDWFPAVAKYNTGGSYAINFGQRPFAYTAPSGFKALCTQNLPTPTIGATSTTQANDYMNVVTYTGNGSTQSITGVGFQPDWTWIKIRNAAGSHALADAVRGSTIQLASNNTDAEITRADTITSFASDGFNLGANTTGYSVNINAQTYVAWNWKANGAGSSNTAGTITSTVSANTTSGFSIVTYTGTGVAATVGHGLGVAPSMIIVKDRDDAGTNWCVYHVSLGNGNRVLLNLTNASAATGNWNSTSPTSSVFSIGVSSEVSANNKQHVAYCFAPVAGYSAFGSYTGNGSTDGPFIFTNFRPRFVIRKCSGATGNWFINDAARDSSNVVLLRLNADLSDAESSGANSDIDFLSNGFKIRATSTAGVNQSGQTHIYMAFAENPFKYSLAR